MEDAISKPELSRVRWSFIHSAAVDLAWYIGSSIAGWLYVALVLLLGRNLHDPFRDPFYLLNIGGWILPLTLSLVVVASWSLLIDAPHVFATLARTWLDPEEWAERRSVLLVSTVWFALGPLAVFGPYAVGALFPLDSATMALPSHLFLVFFRLWAYYHVVRQHWGFFVLYKRRNDDCRDPLENRVDTWFFNAVLYLPLLLFLTAPWYSRTGMPELGLDQPVFHGLSVAALLRPAALAAYPLSIAVYLLFQLRRWQQGKPRNGPKLLLMLAVVPLHLAVFSHPLLALFVVPVVTVGHNLQYHRIVWAFGRSKYLGQADRSYRWARRAFSSVPVYFALGLAFTFFLYQGPFIEVVKTGIAHVFEAWFGGMELMAGVTRIGEAGLGAKVAATFFLGWAMQHYYLDSKIWHIRRDPKLGEHLQVG